MSTTLTNGLKLPDKGSVDWYADMQNNYTILDGAVGTIAEHTSALAGKAPLVHTHTKSDITDFPAYGTTAGTICEGNDSRLSDARTPVAHTHTKSDVTDLFNSVNTWGAAQALKNIKITDHKTAPAADTGIAWNFIDNNNKYWGGIGFNYLTTGASETRIFMSNWTTSGSQGFWHLDFGATKDFSNVYFHPSTNNVVNLGSSSYQWNNLYAKNYFYNGVAWGLDKDNTWTGDNTFKGIYQNQGDTNYIISRGTNTVKGDLTTSGSFSLMFKDKNNGNLVTSGIGYLNLGQNSSGSYATIGVETVGSTDNTRHSNSISFRINPTTNDNTAQFYPVNNNATELGTSTNKWKSINGINPGALSLPGAYQDITAQIKNPSDQLNAIDLNGGSNTWVSDVDCYLYFYIPNNKFTWIRIFWPASLVRCGQTFVPVPNESSDYSGFLPVPANTTVVIQIKGTKAPVFRRSACLGNV